MTNSPAFNSMFRMTHSNALKITLGSHLLTNHILNELKERFRYTKTVADGNEHLQFNIRYQCKNILLKVCNTGTISPAEKYIIQEIEYTIDKCVHKAEPGSITVNLFLDTLLELSRKANRNIGKAIKEKERKQEAKNLAKLDRMINHKRTKKQTSKNKQKSC